MSPSLAQLNSSVGRKIVMAITGLGLFGFVATHLVGNLTLLLGPGPFNEYAHFLLSLGHGAFIYFAEAGLAAFFLFHAVAGIGVYLQKRKARKDGYVETGDAGGPSRKSLASKTMVITGPVLLIFVVLHVIHFKFGAGAEAGYVFEADGESIRDLYRLVVEEFNKGPIVAGYVAVMLLLGLHLRHGVWSAFQSLGLLNKQWLPALTVLALAVGLLLAFGFLYIPVHVFLFVDPASPGILAEGGAL